VTAVASPSTSAKDGMRRPSEIFFGFESSSFFSSFSVGRSSLHLKHIASDHQNVTDSTVRCVPRQVLFDDRPGCIRLQQIGRFQQIPLRFSTPKGYFLPDRIQVERTAGRQVLCDPLFPGRTRAFCSHVLLVDFQKSRRIVGRWLRSGLLAGCRLHNLRLRGTRCNKKRGPVDVLFGH
jgi:hypothetical protein